MNYDVLLFGLFFLFCTCVVLLKAYLLWKKSHAIRRKNRIPAGTIWYSDLNVPATSLFSPKYQLAGKPDYILETKQKIIPVEIKTSTTYKPLHNHCLQLAAYCHLVEITYQQFVPYGLLVYQNTEFTIPFDPKSRFELESVLQHMRRDLKREVHRNHQDVKKCQKCSLNQYCLEKLS